jgi:cyclopropane-fatty-acyl-phospholipid synthase
MRMLSAIFRRIVREGHLAVIDADGKAHHFGQFEKPPVTIRLRDHRVANDIAFNPALKVGEAYMDGRFTVEGGDTIADFLELMLCNLGLGHGGGHLLLLAKLRQTWRRWAQWNTHVKAKRNVAHHYDLSGKLYDLFLDTDKQYSCAFFESPTDTLEAAQRHKKQRIAAKLALQPGMKVLDIGSGWGGLALQLAQQAGADVTGVTLSEEQIKIANERAANSKFQDQVRFHLQDYRNVTGKFDRIVSIGMFEHVGIGHYRAFFEKISSLLNDDGVALIHTIGRADGPGVSNPWISKYIFPGGYTPALSEVMPAIEQSGLITTDVEVWRLHYALTLAEWRRRFVANWDRAAQIYDERFCRMWEFFLAAEEMAFRYQGLVVFQVQLSKRIDALPLTRDYMMPKAQDGAGARGGDKAA